MASIQSITINKFAAYGLNHKRNFLKAPKCECGGKADLCFENEDEVKDFCVSTLQEHNCMEAAVFCAFHDGRYMAVVKQPEFAEDLDDIEKYVYVYIKPSRHKDMFADVDSEFRLCCYSLITEIENGLWRIEE